MNARSIAARIAACTAALARTALAAVVATLSATAQCPLQWQAGAGADGAVLALLTLPDGDLVAGGAFSTIEGTLANNIARRRDGVWQPLGAGVSGPVLALAALPNGDVVAGGVFQFAGSAPASCVARWDGTAWHPLGSGVSGEVFWALLSVRALAVMPNGDLVAGGHFLQAGGTPVDNIARWNGTTWAPLGAGMPLDPQHPPPIVHALAVLPGGDLVAAGQFAIAGTAPMGVAAPIARWNGTAWAAMNTGWPWPWPPAEVVRALLVAPDGALFGAGIASSGVPTPPTQPCVARWTGSAWAPLPGLAAVAGAPAGVALALATSPDGDVLASGRDLTATGAASTQVVRWDGSGWSDVGAVQGGVHALAFADAALAVGGTFWSVGAWIAAPWFARLATPCAPASAPAGAGCASSVGPHTLVAATPPWLGAAFHATAGAVPPNSLALAVTSLSPATIPLAAVLPAGGPGCEGLIAPDYTELLVPSGSEAVTTVPLPDLPAFAGLVLHHYVAVFEFDASGSLLALTSTPRLALTLGAY